MLKTETIITQESIVKINKLTSVFHVCPVVDHEFRHNILEVVDP